MTNECIFGSHKSCTSITQSIVKSPTEAELDKQFSLTCHAEVLSTSTLSIKDQIWYLGDRVTLKTASVNAEVVGKMVTKRTSSSKLLFHKVSGYSNTFTIWSI